MGDRFVGDCLAAYTLYAGKYRLVDDQIECRLLECAPSKHGSLCAIEQEYKFQFPVDVAVSANQSAKNLWEDQLRQLTMPSAVVVATLNAKTGDAKRNSHDEMLTQVEQFANVMAFAKA